MRTGLTKRSYHLRNRGDDEGWKSAGKLAASRALADTIMNRTPHLPKLVIYSPTEVHSIVAAVHVSIRPVPRAVAFAWTFD